MTLRSRRGSRWMSEARWSKAYCQQPVDDLDHALVVGVELLVALAELDQLLEVGERRRLAHLRRVAHRARERVELGRVAGDLDRVDDHQLDVARVCASISGTQRDVERLAGGDRHLGEAEGAAAARGAARRTDRHHVGDAADVDLAAGRCACRAASLRLASHSVSVSVSSTLPSPTRVRPALPMRTSGCCALLPPAKRCAVRSTSSALRILSFAQPGEHGAPGELADGPGSPSVQVGGGKLRTGLNDEIERLHRQLAESTAPLPVEAVPCARSWGRAPRRADRKRRSGGMSAGCPHAQPTPRTRSSPSSSPRRFWYAGQARCRRSVP